MGHVARVVSAVGVEEMDKYTQCNPLLLQDERGEWRGSFRRFNL